MLMMMMMMIQTLESSAVLCCITDTVLNHISAFHINQQTLYYTYVSFMYIAVTIDRNN